MSEIKLVFWFMGICTCLLLLSIFVQAHPQVAGGLFLCGFGYVWWRCREKPMPVQPPTPPYTAENAARDKLRIEEYLKNRPVLTPEQQAQQTRRERLAEARWQAKENELNRKCLEEARAAKANRGPQIVDVVVDGKLHRVELHRTR